MKRLLSFLAAALVALSVSVSAFAEGPAPIIQNLQDISVTIRANGSQGSGTLYTRKVGDNDTVTFVWTAAHVVDGLRKTRSVIDPETGTPRLVVEFEDAEIVKEFTEEGRRIGEMKFDARVVRYSDADQGEDLALLMVRKKNYVADGVGAKFYLDKEIPAIGTELYHVGSLLGQIGSNSLTTGVISQNGRVLNLGANGVIFDQTTVTAFPGSSGGGVYLKSDGRYVGMLVRGAGEQFNFIVPARRLTAWAEKANIKWAVDPSVAMPSADELAKLKVEDTGVSFKSEKAGAKSPHATDEESYGFLIGKTPEAAAYDRGVADGAAQSQAAPTPAQPKSVLRSLFQN